MLRPESESPSHLSKWYCMVPLPILKGPQEGLPVKSAGKVLEAVSDSMLTSCGQKRGCYTPVTVPSGTRDRIGMDFSLNSVLSEGKRWSLHTLSSCVLAVGAPTP